MSANNLISLSAIDYIEVDVQRQTVTVGAGARVSEVLKELSKYGLTLENFSSVQEQQIGGWTQVAAHGTGCTLSTVDDMIVRMKLATPMEGLLTLSSTSNPRLFSVARVGLGSLGVVTELTLKCVPQFKLKETTASIDMDKIAEGHHARLTDYRHVRYMWLPYTSKVISVVSNPVASSEIVGGDSKATSTAPSKRSPPTKPLYELLMSIQPSFDRAKAESLSFSQLRDLLLDHAPLDTAHIRRVNQAEAQFWDATARASVARVDDSTNILGFDCGGEQLVYEVCFPIGSLSGGGSGKDLAFVQSLIKTIEAKQLPAPCPIEQRWSASSSSPMSPAHSSDPGEVFSWVGVIMYLPPGQTDKQRIEIKRRFAQYVEAMQPLLVEYNAHAHWAKIELPEPDSLEFLRYSVNQRNNENKSWIPSVFKGEPLPKPLSYEEKVLDMKTRIAERYDVEEFNSYRRVLDPHGVLSNEMMDELFGSVKTK
jgi:L-galactono-1,4-lactone dehydrogenase